MSRFHKLFPTQLYIHYLTAKIYEILTRGYENALYLSRKQAIQSMTGEGLDDKDL
jgi:hypothetical protein